jgi:serine/threonine protein phosphatase PrpC
MGHRHSKGNHNSVDKHVIAKGSKDTRGSNQGASGSTTATKTKPEIDISVQSVSSGQGSVKSSRRKSDLKDVTKLIPNLQADAPVERAFVSASENEVEKFIESEVRLSRTKSAYHVIKKAFSGVQLMPRSKSTPLPVPRRADICLDEPILAKLKVLQEEMRHTMQSEDSMDDLDLKPFKPINEVKLMKHMRSHCEFFTFGSQRLEGIPGEIRQMNGSLPDGIHVACIKGLKSYADTSANQDNFSYAKCDGYEFFSVQDGHGTCGHIVSYRVVRTLPYYIMASASFPKNIEEAIREGYENCQKDLLAHSLDSGFDLQISGSACVLAIRKNNKVWVTHAGDSRIVIGNKNNAALLFETTDHKPTSPGEQQRLEQSGSDIHTFRFDNGHVEISRVFVKGKDYPGLCMSRSFGDQSVKACGVSAVPEIHTLNVEPGKHFMVLATDGVWEFIPSKLVVSSLAKKIETEGGPKCIDRIVTESKKRWKQNEGSYCDDITAMLVVF